MGQVRLGNVIVISKLLKRQSRTKRRAPAYSRVLRQIRGVVHRIVHGRLRAGCQRVRGSRLGNVACNSGSTVMLSRCGIMHHCLGMFNYIAFIISRAT